MSTLMTADIVNLRTARKRRTRDEREAKAAENRAKFGQSKTEKLTVKAVNELDRRRLDQAKREPTDSNER